MNILKSVLAIGLVGLGLSTPALAQTALEQVKTAGALRVGTEGTYATISQKYFGEDVSQ